MNGAGHGLPLAGGLDALLFRRQFILGPRRMGPRRHWSSLQLSDALHLSVHDALPAASCTSGDVTAVLLGIAIDPAHPERTEPEILRALVAGASEVDSFIAGTRPLGGRWVMIYHHPRGTCLFTDPLGFRQVYYHFDAADAWCASQPELIREHQPLSWSADETLLRLLIDPGHARMESTWVGQRTIYDHCFQLLPNHYLDLGRRTQIRFYPRDPIPERPLADVLDRAVPILQGSMSAIARRRPRLALTAGWDSRVLLAASRHVAGTVEFFVDRMGVLPHAHPDVWVPTALAARLNLDFVVDNASVDPPGWLVSLLSRNVTGARVLPKTRSIFRKLIAGEARVNVNGNGSEICRNRFDRRATRDTTSMSTAEIVRLYGYRDAPKFAMDAIDEWRAGLEPRLVGGLNLLDMLHWEQRLGHWGAQYPAEQDIVVDEISPYNNRLLIETLMSSDRGLRCAPDYRLYRELVHRMWPEALALPVNPPPRVGLIGSVNRRVRPYVPTSVVKAIRKVLA